MAQNMHDPKGSYDQIADIYADRCFYELDSKPKDRELLDRLVAEARSLGPICDMGCGPGEIARYLKDHGADALGLTSRRRWWRRHGSSTLISSSMWVI